MEEKKPLLPAGWKLVAYGVIAGAVVAIWTGFDALGWKTKGAAEELAKRQSESAVVAAHASICAEQFRKAPDLEGRLAALEKVERYSRGDFVAKGGWANIMGVKDAGQGVAQQCADLVLPPKN